MKTILTTILAIITGALFGDCKDGKCTAMPPPISAIPDSAISPITQAARIKTLNGKTIAIVGGSFMAKITHPELKRLILKEFPSAKIYLLGEIGAAGPYPRPGIIRHEKDEFQKKLKEFKVDAVISGNGGCGLCTPKETGSCIAAEVIGIPSVMIAGPGFVRQAKSTASAAGVEILRVAEYPGAFASHTQEELIDNTRRILWPRIKQALMEPLRESERFADDSGVGGDGLPVITPTEERIAEFLKFTDLPPDHLLGNIPPMHGRHTVG